MAHASQGPDTAACRRVSLFFLLLFCLFFRFGIYFLDDGLCDPLVLNIGDRYAQAVHFNSEGLSVFRYFMQAGEYHAADCVVVPVFGNLHAQFIFKILNRQCSRNFPAVDVELLDFRSLGFIEFVIDISDDFLKKILKCYDASGLSVLINDYYGPSSSACRRRAGQP